MTLGQRLMEFRKGKGLSQEDVAHELNVTRQTVSKWETDQSTPDFDKIIPLCELYGISSDELLTGKKDDVLDEKTLYENADIKKGKRIKGIVLGIFLYFVAIAWIMISVASLALDPVIASAIFMIIAGVATVIIIYSSVMYKSDKKEKKENKLFKQIEDILSLFTVIVYLVISFMTMAWHITWMIWLVFALVMAIIKLVFYLRGVEDEK